jgi:pimeloyl-ACP methyl ester carboxylesterase
MRRTCVTFAACLLAIVLVAPMGAAAAPPGYFVDSSKLPFDALPGTSTTRYWGIHNRAGYRVEVPANWNGDLVLYAHGYRGEGLELTVSNPSIRAYLVNQGFAWAASSYSTNGYDVQQGVQDTHALGLFFNSLAHAPKRTYIMGHSMGGHVTGVAIEQFPNEFAGALPMCGVMGDVELFDYFLDFYVLAQQLAGVPAQFPPPANYQIDIVPMVKARLGSPYPYVLNSQGMMLRAAIEQRSGGSRPFFDAAFVSWGNFLFTLLSGDGSIGVAPGNVVSNIGTVYQLDSDHGLTQAEQDLNAAVLRVAASPQGIQPAGLANIPPIAGTFRIPVVSMHTIGDLFVPLSMEQIYARRAAANGTSQLLVSRAIRDIGHCGFTESEQVAAFADLVRWVDAGVKPAGDDILKPDVVASSAFGCAFTLVWRSYAPCAP